MSLSYKHSPPWFCYKAPLLSLESVVVFPIKIVIPEIGFICESCLLGVQINLPSCRKRRPTVAHLSGIHWAPGVADVQLFGIFFDIYHFIHPSFKSLFFFSVFQHVCLALG